MKDNQDEKHGGLLAAGVVVGSLYLARPVLIPIALALFFAFLLEPLAKRFERIHLGRVISSLAAVSVAIAVLAGLFYCVIGQLGDFGNNLPKYEETIHAKIRHLHVGDGAILGHAFQSMEDFRKDLAPTNAGPSTNAIRGKSAVQAEAKPVPVEIENKDSSALQILRDVIGPSVNFLVTLFLVAVFCVFILAGRDDLRVRFIRVVRSRNIKLTDHLLNDTGERVSRYLLMQLIVNSAYGIPIGLGLCAIGIPNPLLWGMVAAVFRYIPYAGPWIAAIMPLAIGVAVGPDWTTPILVLALYGCVEILTANFVEPWLYGNSTGITPLAVLVAAVFWAWLWGPIGLLLSVPLTVCLVSIARHVPQLELLHQLFGEADVNTTNRKD